MFQCNHCNREYGGIRGITIDRTVDLCPRCATNGKNGFQAPMTIRATAPQRRRELITAGLSAPA